MNLLDEQFVSLSLLGKKQLLDRLLERNVQHDQAVALTELCNTLDEVRTPSYTHESQ